jgi:hypothetical protein
MAIGEKNEVRDSSSPQSSYACNFIFLFVEKLELVAWLVTCNY